MSFFSKLFGKKKQPEQRIGGMEDFMLLIRVYYQAAIAAQTGFNNLGALPDLRIYKQKNRIATQNNKLGVAEKRHCKQMIQDLYGLEDGFFGEIEQSLKKRCRRITDVQGYLLGFQNFSQELIMVMSNLMQWKFRLPKFLSKSMKKMVAKQIHDVLTKNDWSDAGVRRSCINIRKYQKTLGYSEKWMTDYVHTIVMLAKKEPKLNSEE